MEVASFTPRLSYHRSKGPRYVVDWWLTGSRTSLEAVELERNLLPLMDIESRSVAHYIQISQLHSNIFPFFSHTFILFSLYFRFYFLSLRDLSILALFSLRTFVPSSSFFNGLLYVAHFGWPILLPTVDETCLTT